MLYLLPKLTHGASTKLNIHPSESHKRLLKRLLNENSSLASHLFTSSFSPIPRILSIYLSNIRHTSQVFQCNIASRFYITVQNMWLCIKEHYISLGFLEASKVQGDLQRAPDLDFKNSF